MGGLENRSERKSGVSFLPFACPKYLFFRPVVAKIIDFPRSPFWIRKSLQKMATMLAKITQISRLDYRHFPRIFFDSNGGNGDKKMSIIWATTDSKIVKRWLNLSKARYADQELIGNLSEKSKGSLFLWGETNISVPLSRRALGAFLFGKIWKETENLPKPIDKISYFSSFTSLDFFFSRPQEVKFWLVVKQFLIGERAVLKRKDIILFF